jgi:plastocyanin
VHLTRLIATTAAAACLTLAPAACGDDPGPATTAAAPGDAAGSAGDPTAVTCVAGDGGDAAVAIARFTFDPGDLDVVAGAMVTFTNQDATDHSVWSAARAGGDPAWESAGSDPTFRLPEVLHEGDTSTCTFPAAGTYEYLCGIHNSMTGTIVVR